jgi:hypothetical protein
VCHEQFGCQNRHAKYHRGLKTYDFKGLKNIKNALSEQALTWIAQSVG